MKLSQVCGPILLLFAVHASENSQIIIREKRTIEFLLHKFADSLGFRVVPKQVSIKNSGRIGFNPNMLSQQPFAHNFNIFGLNDLQSDGNKTLAELWFDYLQSIF